MDQQTASTQDGNQPCASVDTVNEQAKDDDVFHRYAHCLFLETPPLLVTMRNSETKKIRAMTDALKKREQLITFGPSSEKKNEWFKLKVINEKYTAATIHRYEILISYITSFFMRCSQPENWKATLNTARFLIDRNHLMLWHGIIIDCLWELYKEHNFTKLLLALEISEGDKLSSWIAGYLEYCLNNGHEISINTCAGNTTALISAIDKDLKALVPLLLKAGADPNSANEEGATPLIFATAKGCVETMKYLLESGALIDSQDQKGLSALQYAISYRHEDAVALLALRKASLEIREKETNMTPLIMAIDRRFPKGVSILLEAGADPNSVSHVSNFSTLMFAIAEYSAALHAGTLAIQEETEKTFAVVELLINHPRSDLALKNGQGYTARKIAAQQNLQEVLTILDKLKM